MFAVEDSGDATQAEAHKALGEVFNQALSDLSVGVYRDTPLVRLTVGHLAQSVEFLGHALHLLIPGERVFHRAPLVSGTLRVMTDVYARQLEIWGSADSDLRLEEVAAESVRQERLAYKAAGRAGAAVDELINRAAEELAALPTARGVNIANVLENAREHELECVYRFESAHVHFGETARRARTRVVSTREMDVGIHLDPLSLWRMGQVTWATLGVWRRLVSFLCSRIELELPFLALALTAERVVRAAAQRERRSNEPPSPPYHEFDFPLWTP